MNRLVLIVLKLQKLEEYINANDEQSSGSADEKLNN